MTRRSALLAGTVVAAVAAIGAVQLLPGAAPSAQAAGLIGYDGCRDLLAHYRAELTRSATAYGFGYGNGGFAIADDVGGTPSAASAGGARESASGLDAVGSGPTGTNVQEQGVDEPDLVKLQDGRLVVFTGNRVRVLSADEQPRVLGSLRISGDQAYGGELLLDGDRAVALVPGYRADARPAESPSGDVADRSMIWNPGTPTTRVLLLDLSGDQPRLVEDATYDAQYVSARLVDGTVRLVTTTRPQPVAYYPQEPTAFDETAARRFNQQRAAAVTLDEVLPQVVRRSADGTVLERGSAVDCDRTYHARTATGVSTLLVTTMRPAEGLAPTDSTAVTTDGDLVYASTDRLYVATSRWGTVGPVMPLARGIGGASRPSVGEVSTELHAFDTSSATETTYVGTGTVPGYVMGRWALSSYDGALRVATTRQPPWDGERTGDSSSMVVKLVERDGRLVETGRVGGLGRTEQIKAVRYFGDVAAVVTFRQTDPLYLLDLSGTPKVLGELKIPGFSTYLHPIGDGKLLGLGQDADENGGVTGVQVSVFDISDLSRPTQVDRVHLGPGWTAALDDSRAFTYDPDSRLATFAFSAYDEASGQRTTALGLAVDRSGHLREVGRMDLDQDSWSSRVLMDDGRVFAVAETGVVAGDIGSWSRTGSVRFDASPFAGE